MLPLHKASRESLKDHQPNETDVTVVQRCGLLNQKTICHYEKYFSLRRMPMPCPFGMRGQGSLFPILLTLNIIRL